MLHFIPMLMWIMFRRLRQVLQWPGCWSAMWGGNGEVCISLSCESATVVSDAAVCKLTGAVEFARRYDPLAALCVLPWGSASCVRWLSDSVLFCSGGILPGLQSRAGLIPDSGRVGLSGLAVRNSGATSGGVVGV
ncbi:MAG TPA: hypothetical protein DIT89_12630 [Planctomycetaceae bacterium]|nr:hypothetical protein [Planctomycetaceae bacterium]